jgi:arsenite-transporting ATPase
MRAVESFQGMFGGGGGTGGAGNGIGGALSKLEGLQTNLAKMKALLQDPATTQFAVVTIPTTLAVVESVRLVDSLRGQGVAVSCVVVNQVLSEQSGPKYIDTRRQAQLRCIDSITSVAGSQMEVTQVGYVDTEVTGLYGLKYFAAVAHPPIPRTASNPMNSKKLTIFGGKGIEINSREYVFPSK